MTREELIQMAEKKHEREQLIAAAEEKFKSGSTSVPESDVKGESFLQGLGQAESLGYLPELQAGAAKLVSDPQSGLNEKLKAQGINVVEPKFDLSTDQARSRDLKLRSEAPDQYLTGNIAGGLVSSPIYGAALGRVGLGGGMAAKGAIEGIKQGLITGAKQGAALGLVSNPNQRPGDEGIQPLARIGQSAGGAAVGGAVGSAVGGLMGRFGKVLPEKASVPEDSLDVQTLNKRVDPRDIEINPPEPTAPTTEPVSFKDLKTQVGEMRKSGTLKDSPSVGRVEEIVKNNPDLPKPIPGLHKEALADKGAYEKLRNYAEAPTPAGEQIRFYEQGMKQAAQQKLAKLVMDHGERPPLGKLESGDNLMNIVGTKYSQTKEQLGPLFEEFKDMRLPKVQIVPEIRQNLVDNIPKLNKYLNVDEETGNLALAPFTPKMGITSQAHGDLNKVVGALNSKSLSFEDLQNIREFLRQSIDPVNPKATQVLADARKSMLDYMDYLVGSRSPSKDVRGTFKQYAINEKNLDSVERIIGGKIEHMDQLMNANPERVLDKIYANSNNIKVMKQAIGDPEFKNLTSDYLYNLVERASDKGTVSAAKLSSLIKQRGHVLKEALSPEESRRLTDLVDYMRLMPDTPSPNPSGTARSAEIIGKLMHGNVMGSVKEGVGLLKDIHGNVKSINELNKIMAAPKKVPLRGGTVPGGLVNTAIQSRR